MRKIYFFICLFIAFCIGNQAVAAKKEKLSFEGRNSWFYIISDGRYLTWNPDQNILILTKFTSSLNAQWTLDLDGRLYNRAKGEEYSIGSKKLVVASLVRNGKAVLSDGHISLGNKSLGVSSDGEMKFGENPALMFMMHPVEITPQQVGLTKLIGSFWKNKQNAHHKEVNKQWLQEYDLYQFWDVHIFNTPDNNDNSPIKELLRRAPEIIATAQEYADNSKRGDWISYPTYRGSIRRELNQDLVQYNGDYYVCRPISMKGYTAPKFLRWSHEDYSYPFKTCIGQPTSKRTYKISKNKWIITYEEQVQVAAESSGRGDCSVLHPMQMLNKDTFIDPSSPPKAPKIGTYSTTYNLWEISVPAKATCSRKYWQTYTKGQGYLGERLDPFAPWRIKQTMVIEFNMNDYLNQLDWMPKELAALYLLDKALELGSKFGWQGRCIPIAVYKAYSKELNTLTKPDIEKYLSERQIKKAVILANTFPNSANLEHVYEKIFTLCKTPDELLSAFSEVYEALYGEPILTEHFAFYAFANLTWPDIHPTKPQKKHVPSCFTHYIKKRDELFSDYANVVIKDSNYSRAFYSYLFYNLIGLYDLEIFTKVQSCPNQKFCSDIRTKLSQDVIDFLYHLVISYSTDKDIVAFSKGLDNFDYIINSGLIETLNYNSMRKEAIADVSKLLSEQLISVFNQFDQHWIKGTFDVNYTPDELSMCIKLNSEFYQGELIRDAMLSECKIRIDAYEALKEADEWHLIRFVDKWGNNNIYADKLKQEAAKNK